MARIHTEANGAYAMVPLRCQRRKALKASVAGWLPLRLKPGLISKSLVVMKLSRILLELSTSLHERRLPAEISNITVNES